MVLPLRSKSSCPGQAALITHHVSLAGSTHPSLTAQLVVAKPLPLQIECDGQILPLPDDIEGILLCNINSYMGGVDLWASGLSTGPMTQGVQSTCDGKLEVCAPAEQDLDAEVLLVGMTVLKVAVPFAGAARLL